MEEPILAEKLLNMQDSKSAGRRFPEGEWVSTCTASMADALSGDPPSSKQIVARSTGYLHKQQAELTYLVQAGL